VERGRGSKDLVRAREVAPVVPPAAGRNGAGHSGLGELRRPRLLNHEIKPALEREARAHSFDAVGVTRPDALGEAKAHFERFIAAGHHGDMDWLASTAARRTDPLVLWPEARAVIMLGMNYGPDGDPLAILRQRDRGAISVYAQGDDYHDLIKSKLKAIARWLVANAGGDVKVFVDTAAVMEKPLAASAGLGWQGKHTNLVSRQHGSWLFLGAIFTTLELPADASETDHCGTCRACLDICPTSAFPAPYRLDARRCISYLTIEHKGPIPRELRGAMGNRIYGCDDCLAVCPWNKFAQAGREAKLAAREALRAPGLAELARLDDAAFRALFAKSPVKRTGRDRFVRNVAIAIGNSCDSALASALERLLGDASPLVRGVAVWALGRLDAERLEELAPAHRARENDAEVQDEWRAALAETRLAEGLKP
jgi:epoxyqueuosine reductase